MQRQDHEKRLEHLDSIRTIFERTFNQDNTDAWEKYSASVGMAEYASDGKGFPGEGPAHYQYGN